MKAAIAVAAVIALSVLATVALYQAVRWFAALRLAGDRHGATLQAYKAERTRLEDERRRLLNHLREIRFDHDTGKIDLADYEALRARYEREALAVLAALDALDASTRLDGGRRA